MSLDPLIAAHLRQAQEAPQPASLAALRTATDASLRQMHGPLEDVASIRDYIVPGEPALTVRAYVPAAAQTATALPAIVFAHGGGWCLGSLDVYDNPCRALANATGNVIFSVDYRLAPEHPFPAPLNDVYRALCWVAEQAAALGIDAGRLAVGGDSAGGNLAAAAALMARDLGGPALAHQLLLYPALDFSFDTPSYQRYAEGYSLTREAMRFCWSAYLATPADGEQPYAAPLRAASLQGLPPATIIVCEYDPLHDEGVAYAQRLREAGVAVACQRLDGLIHAAMHMPGVTPAARRLYALAGEAMNMPV
ncbi:MULTISPECIES: alpha/beta hydrolase [unclassified Janthinobacterium]|uniref:alpha/beta hydrolase n=1 Tax=unclassified Janthinobacterium TaxID=2610881 RepID=UPI00160EEB78|nr:MULTISPECIES: alpha/beta hydrolase [unclassified Janthinobacterium]MBB5607157.1 acetyl esterase [Janthinobacterium sp. S3T4]MBB5612882.1 acetyl esterase [Janthinobacterium sp. S3M3]